MTGATGPTGPSGDGESCCGTVSLVNCTTTPLVASATFTGVFEDVSLYDSLTVAVATDQDGQYAVEFSPDGSNIDSTLTRYYRINRINAPHRFTITRQFVRVVFTNGAGGNQTYLRLQTMFGPKQDLNIPTDAVVPQAFDATMVRPTDPRFEIALGLRQGQTAWQKWGFNPAIETKTPEMIWEPGGDLIFLSTASTLSISSSDAKDTSPTGDGARSIVITGINADRLSQTEVVSLNGTSPVVTAATWLGINRAAVSLAGSDGQNVGKITIEDTLGNPQATIPSGLGTSQQPIFFTQAGHTALAQDLMINVLKTSGGGQPVVTITGWVFSFVSKARYEVFRYLLDTAVESSFIYNPINPFPVGEQSVIYFQGHTTSDDTVVTLRFSLVEQRAAAT